MAAARTAGDDVALTRVIIVGDFISDLTGAADILEALI